MILLCALQRDSYVRFTDENHFSLITPSLIKLCPTPVKSTQYIENILVDSNPLVASTWQLRPWNSKILLLSSKVRIPLYGSCFGICGPLNTEGRLLLVFSSLWLMSYHYERNFSFFYSAEIDSHRLSLFFYLAKLGLTTLSIVHSFLNFFFVCPTSWLTGNI